MPKVTPYKKKGNTEKIHGKKVKIGKGVYTIYLHSEIKHPEKIQAYKEYRLSQLPTFEECVLAMKEGSCLDVEKVRQTLQKNIAEGYLADSLCNDFVALQKAEADNQMWDGVVGRGWSVVEMSYDDNEFESVCIHSNVIKYLDSLAKQILEETSYGPASSTSKIFNILEDAKHQEIAVWYRRYAKEIRSLEEGKDYR